jgi:predicted P-loop ATPase
MLTLTLTTHSRAALSLEEESFTPEELTAILSDPEVGHKDGYAFIPARFAECPSACWKVGQDGDCGGRQIHRHRNNARWMTAFCADVDHVTEARMQGIIEHIRALGVEFWVWETYSHDPEAVARGEEAGRYRVIVPFNEPLLISNPEQWSQGAWPALMRYFGIEGSQDSMCRDPSRLYFLPRKPKASDVRETAHFPGKVFEPSRVLGDLSRLAKPLPVPLELGEMEDPTRPVDLEDVKDRLVDTRNPTTAQLATRAVRGELLTALPADRKPGEMSRHEAWWRLTGRLSIVAEDWMATDALLELLKPSHRAERKASPDDFTPWDGERDSVVEMLAAQRATAPMRRAQYAAERQARNAVALDALNKVVGSRKEKKRSPEEEPSPGEDTEEGPWSAEDVASQLEVKHSATGAVSYPGSAWNLALVLQYAPDWAGAFRFNCLRQRAEVEKSARLGIKEVTPVDDDLTHTLTLLLAKDERWPMKARDEDVRRALEWVARRNPFEPVQAYLGGLTWDGTKRLGTWLIDYCHAQPVAEDGADLRAYLAAIGTRWMVAAVARAFEPGCKADDMLHFDGPQGLKKSTALEVLGGEWFCEGTLNFEHRDTAFIISTAWIVELGEKASFDRASEAVQKAFLSRKSDVIVPKYSNDRVDLKRRCVFAGTGNNDEYLTDTTGNRRHWVLSMTDRTDSTALRRDRNQLWAEAVSIYREGFACPECAKEERCAAHRWWLTDEENLVARREAARRMQTDILDDLIEIWFRARAPEKRPRSLTPGDVAANVLDDKRGGTPKRKITAALKRLGFTTKAIRTSGDVVRRWVTPERLLTLPHDRIGQREENLETLATAKQPAQA